MSESNKEASIKGAEYQLRKIFSSDFDYVIPEFQRPYAWTENETTKLFEDLYDFWKEDKEQKASYFLGSIVLIKEENKPLAEVIDGQQRLTTLTILLAVMASLLNGEVRSRVEEYVCEPGNKIENLLPKPRLALRERDREFFANSVQNFAFGALWQKDPSQLEEAQRHIRENSLKLKELLSENFGETIDESKLIDFCSFLMTRCFLVVVSTPNRHSAFRVFSVLNNRGLDLQASDLVKATLIGKIPLEQQKEYADKWEDMEERCTREGLNEVLIHIRMIVVRKRIKKNLLEEFKDEVMKDHAPRELIDKVIVPYADAWRRACNQDYVASSFAEEINRMLFWLGRFEQHDWLAPAMCALALPLPPERLLPFLTGLERLAAYFLVTGKKETTRAARYGEIIADLQGAQNTAKLELEPREQQVMLKKLNDNLYTDMYNATLKYTLLRLDSFLSDGAATYYVFSSEEGGGKKRHLFTIEHVLPQHVKPGSEWEQLWPDPEERGQWTHRLANLVVLNQARNSKARDYDFDKKKNAYFMGKKDVSSFALLTQVLNTPVWTPEVVRQRQRDLLSVLARGWKLDAAAMPEI